MSARGAVAFGKRNPGTGPATFGRRTAPAAQPATASLPGGTHVTAALARERPAGAPPQRKIIPDELWQGQHGDFLRELGLSPDDASNLVPDAHSVNARLESDRAKHEAKLAEINRSVAERVPGGLMRQFSLLPDPCWNGELGRFLMMRLDLFPYDDWNMILLPADEKTAEALNLPLHPNGNIPTFVATAEVFLRSADERLRAAHAEAGHTHDFGKFHDTLEEIRDKVKALARSFLGEMDKAWENRHEA
jgi:hypothetical protein